MYDKIVEVKVYSYRCKENTKVHIKVYISICIYDI